MASNRIISPLLAGTKFREFSLYLNYGQVALLPDEHGLVLNIESGHFTLINWSVRYVIADGKLSMIGELPLALALLDAWPSYVPTAKLLQAMTDRSAQEIAELLDIARQGVLEPLYCHLEACREHLRTMGLDIEEQPSAIPDQPHRPGFKLSRTTQGGR